MPIRHWLLDTFFSREVDQRIQAATRVADDPTWRALNEPRAALRPWPELRQELEQIAALCRRNPLAARLVAMTTDFVIGGGATLTPHPLPLGESATQPIGNNLGSPEPPAASAAGALADFPRAFWDHPLNRLDVRLYRWCDELTRSGELFLALSRNPADGMSYVREIPARLIDVVETDADDLERELRYHQLTDDIEGRWWPGRESDADQIVLHYTINKPVGEVRGVSDLAQILPWLEHYDLWLQDRVRINRYKGAYLWQVKVEGALPGQIEAKRAQYSRVPSPGSIIVTDGRETWSAVQPHIQADDVEADGKALRLMIAAGAGVPLHFLAEGESATRATAREMGAATYRHFSHRQHLFAHMVEDVIRVAARRAGLGEIAVAVTFDEVMAERD